MLKHRGIIDTRIRELGWAKTTLLHIELVRVVGFDCENLAHFSLYQWYFRELELEVELKLKLLVH